MPPNKSHRETERGLNLLPFLRFEVAIWVQ
jgi:hypothetical protein